MGRAPQQLRTGLRGYARCICLAFQIPDDLLDSEDKNPFLGKRIGKYGLDEADAEQRKLLINLLSEDHSHADDSGSHRIIIEPYGYRWYRVGGLDYLLRRTEVDQRAHRETA
jgi:geranylgeranyl pyrophosphate synthase